MYLDSKKATDMIRILHSYFDLEDKKDFATVEFPSKIEYRSEEWLNYIFFSCLLDYGMKSKIYHKNLINTYEKYPEIFNCRYVLDNFKDDGAKLLYIIKNNIHPRYPNIALKKWINLCIELSKYDNIFVKISSFNSFEQLNKFIKNIGGYGQKTGGLLLRLIYESNICNLNDKISAIPLDRHDIEISYLNRIIDKKEITSKQIEDLSKMYIKIGNNNNISPVLIDKYLWEIGNRFCNKKECIKCPLNKSCKTKI